MKSLWRAGLLSSALMLMLLGFSVDTRAQSYSYNSGASNAATYNGYQLGYGAGSNDRVAGSSFNVERNKAFRDADSGYSNSGFRSKGEYQQVFRSAYETGYRDGYAGNPRQVYYGGDVFNNGGTTYSNDPNYPYGRSYNYRIRERNRRYRNRDYRYWPY